MPRSPWALLRARPPGRAERVWLAFQRPLEVLTARRRREVVPLLRAAEAAANAGRWAVGFVAYEAAPAFDPALVTRPPDLAPLAWFAIFSHAGEPLRPPPAGGPAADLAWRRGVSRADYRAAIARIRDLIAAGDTYQVNLTWRLDASFDGDPWPLFHRLVGRFPTDHAAFLDTGDGVVVSASPELFFRLEDGRLTCRPMKGTLGRGRHLAEDRRRALELYDSPKNRAENLMIVDMVRNDLGRIARPGSVEVASLFDLERLATVFQLTSTVTAESGAGASEIFAALFPCASVTGAPKVRTMQIIADLERSPRGIYTGAVGYLAPGGHAEMAVAIRTVWIDHRRRRARYGTGGGIVWDSQADDEYDECLAKTRILGADEREFELLESLLWTAGEGYRLLERHLDRLASSARYFGFRVPRQRVAGELRRLGAALARAGARRRLVRLLASRDGGVRLETRAAPTGDRPWRLALAASPIDRGDRFLFHKTTRRDVYDRAREAAVGYDDVVLWNAAGELTESCRANLAVRRRGGWWTPPIEAGLLAGCERQERLASGELREGSVRLADLGDAEGIALLNSVRGWIAVDSVTDLERGRLWPPGGGSPRRPERGRNPERADS